MSINITLPNLGVLFRTICIVGNKGAAKIGIKHKKLTIREKQGIIRKC
jgi:hypothetical protein